MSRWTSAEGVLVALACIVAIVFILVDGSARPAASFTPTVYAPLPSSDFAPWWVEPLVRPIRPPDPTLSAIPSATHRPQIATPRPAGGIGTAVGAVKGTASFYAYHPGQAAAAKRLRDAIGPNWRGTLVEVRYAGRKPIFVVLTDFESSTLPGRLIDLSEEDFGTLVGPGWYQRGRVGVTVTW